MADKVIETITHTETVGKKKATIDRIQAHPFKSAGVDDVWSTKNLEKILEDISVKNLIEFENGAYKVKLKPCQVSSWLNSSWTPEPDFW